MFVADVLDQLSNGDTRLNEHATQYILNSIGVSTSNENKHVHKTSTIRNFKRTSAFNLYGGMAKTFNSVSFNVFEYSKHAKVHLSMQACWHWIIIIASKRLN